MTIAFAAPITAASPAAPLSVQAADFYSEIAAGAVAVDVRSVAARREHGALFGALALDLGEAIDLLDPASRLRLRSARPDSNWLLVTEDGYDAEMLAWYLQARGVTGARFLVGGHRALRSAGIHGRPGDDGLTFYDVR